MFELYWFFQCHFCLSKLQHHENTNILLWAVHDMVSPILKSVGWNLEKLLPNSDLVQILKPYLLRFVNFLNSKLVKLCRENLLCSYLPQPHELRLWSLGSGGTYGSYGRAVTGFPARIKTDPGWGLYPINLGLLPLEVQNCLKNFYRDVKIKELELLSSTHVLLFKLLNWKRNRAR